MKLSYTVGLTDPKSIKSTGDWGLRGLFAAKAAPMGGPFIATTDIL